MKTILLSLSLLMITLAYSQEISIIPRPAQMTVGKGHFVLNRNTTIVIHNGVDQGVVDFFNDYLKMVYGFTLKQSNKAGKNFISFVTLETLLPGEEGAYGLSVSSSNISIDGQTASGTFYGMQSLIQLIPLPSKMPMTQFMVPVVNINDKPRFPYRGMHLDVCRHFFPVRFIKKYIDYIAFHKMNVFHWHLTDDQGWRIEIKKYPELTRTGAYRNGTIIGRYPGKGSDNKDYGGFYTQEEVREVVAYAAKRFITIVPEIETPGHSSAAIAAYPFLSCFPNEPTKIPAKMISQKSIAQQAAGRIKLVQETWGVFDDVFCAGKDSTFDFLDNVLDEVMDLFPSKYIHAGGDEVPKANWKRCPLCQQRIQKEGLKDEHELQRYFIERIEKHLNERGRTLVGWDEILEGGLAPNAVVMSWRGIAGGIAAARQNHDVIMTADGWLYFDHSQSQREDSITIGGYTPLEKVYGYEPIPDSLTIEQGKHIRGAQANLWAEYLTNERKVEYMLFPRMSALSELDWSPAALRDWKDFQRRLRVQFKRYDAWKANYSKAYFDLHTSIQPAKNYNGLDVKLESPDKTIPIMYNKNLGMKMIRYTVPVHVSGNTNIFAYSADRPDNKIKIYLQFNKATGKVITLSIPSSPNYPGDGAFTLVDGVVNTKGFLRTIEFLGFNGTDCEATIDLGSLEKIKTVTVNALTQEPSWIYQPSAVETQVSADGVSYHIVGKSSNFIQTENGKGTITLQLTPSTVRYVKVIVKNWGSIAQGNPGAGNRAWLFLDEIAVE